MLHARRTLSAARCSPLPPCGGASSALAEPRGVSHAPPPPPLPSPPPQGGRGKQVASLFAILAVAIIAPFVAAISPANAEAKHGLSAFGDLAYPPDFKNF